MKHEYDVKPVKKIELNEKNVKLRLIVLILLIITIITSAVLILVFTFSKSSGWTQILTTNSEISDVDSDFYFQYKLGESDMGATAESKAVSKLYTNTLVADYKDFDAYNEYDNVHNIYYINHHLNEEIEVSEFLYNSLNNLMNDLPDFIYYGALFNYYDSIILSSNEYNASRLDPNKNEEALVEVERIINYIKMNSVKLELLGENKLRLSVSNEYLEYLSGIDSTVYISFGYLKNAFILDDLYEKMVSNGYVYGYIQTYDGYFANLYKGGNYNLNLYTNESGTVENPASLIFNKRIRGISFRNFITYYSYDLNLYFNYSDGTVISPFVDTETGLNKASINSLTVYSDDISCVNAAINGSKYYISDTFDMESLINDSTAYYAFIIDSTVYYDNSIVLAVNIDTNLVKGYKAYAYNS